MHNLIKKEIEEIIKYKHPSSYKKVVKSFSLELFNEINLIDKSDNFNEKLFIWLFSPQLYCKYGKRYKFKNFSIKYTSCKIGCKCYREKLSDIKSKMTIEDKKIANIKRKNTNLEKYGVDNQFQSEIVKNQIKNKILEKYGVDNPAKSITIQEKIKNTSIIKYGEHCSLMNENIKNKIKTTLYKRYGVVHPSKINLNEKAKKITPQDIQVLNEKFTLKKISEIFGTSESWAAKNLKKGGYIPKYFNYSFLEQEVKDYFTNIELITSSRNIINPYELDIYIPSHNLAIEINGNYWHSEHIRKDKLYHLKKTNLCKEKGIHLIHVWEFLWNTDKELYIDIFNLHLAKEINFYIPDKFILDISLFDANIFKDYKIIKEIHPYLISNNYPIWNCGEYIMERL